MCLQGGVLRITTQETDEAIRLLLEGKLSGPWVAELERAVSNGKASSPGRSIVVDLSGLTGTDAAGRNLLASIRSGGATLRNPSPLSMALLSGGVLGLSANQK